MRTQIDTGRVFTPQEIRDAAVYTLGFLDGRRVYTKDRGYLLP